METVKIASKMLARIFPLAIIITDYTLPVRDGQHYGSRAVRAL